MVRMTEKVRPVRRIVETRRGDLVVELRADGLLLRPKGRRTAAVLVSYGAVYERALGTDQLRRPR